MLRSAEWGGSQELSETAAAGWSTIEINWGSGPAPEGGAHQGQAAEQCAFSCTIVAEQKGQRAEFNRGLVKKCAIVPEPEGLERL